MSSTLKINWATHEAAKHACVKWHYSGCMPAGKLVKIGAWENGAFIGVVIFGRGANNKIGSPYGLGQEEVVELVRIALRKHEAPVTRIVRLALAFLRKNSPGIRLIVSYADPKQGHHGGVYQGGNWVYPGKSQPQRQLVIGGVVTHKRTACANYGTASPEKIRAMSGKQVEWAPVEWKHTYLMPLDAEMRERILPLAKPYPKRATSTENDAPGIQPGEGGVIPTVALQSSKP